MKQLFTLTMVLLLATTAAMAQNSNSSASQTTKLALSNAIEISFTATGTATGNTTTLTFSNVNDYANGVESGNVQLKVRSNKKFIVRAKTASSKFSYSGSTSPAPQMNVQNILFIKVTGNNTGGTVPSNVNNKYRTLKTGNTTLINNGTAGGNNTFDVQYKANPGYNFPAGTYSVDVIYTATQS